MEGFLGTILGFLGVALAIITPGIGSSVGVGLVGRSGAGVITEDPDKFGSILLLEAIPGTQGVYGFLTGLMIMIRIGALGGGLRTLTVGQGILFIMAAMPIAVVGWVSAIFQGRVAAAGVALLPSAQRRWARLSSRSNGRDLCSARAPCQPAVGLFGKRLIAQS